MTERKACVLIGLTSLVIGAGLVGIIMITHFNGVPLVVAIFAALGLLFLGLDAFFCALFRAKPATVLGDDLLDALLRLLLAW